MLRIKISNDNISERKHIIDILLGEFLGLKYKIEIESNSKNWEIILENGNKLIIEDYFFNKFPKDLEYLQEENIPKKVEFGKNDFIVEDDIPIIYGTNKLIINNQSTITCGIDIFASSFFMLTRWEEYVNKTRDKYNRFPAYASLAFKNNFLDRPVVNEYIEMLWNMFKFLGCNQERKKREYELVLTHDVDVPLKYRNIYSGLKEIVGDIVKRKNFKLAFENLISKFKTHLKLKKDPFDTFDYLMNVSESVNSKSYFFFMGKGTSGYDNRYSSDDKFVLRLVENIKNRGHFIGIHPTYNAYNDINQFKKEKLELERNFNLKITFGREHYLRFEVPTTWQIWEDNEMEWDSTLSFADKEGFRCGVCCLYSVYNILTRKKLNLKERPLIVMEGSFTTYQPDITPEQMEQKIKELMNKVKKYNGEFVFLWHNSSFNSGNWLKFQDIYEKVLLKNYKK